MLVSPGLNGDEERGDRLIARSSICNIAAVLSRRRFIRGTIGVLIPLAVPATVGRAVTATVPLPVGGTAFTVPPIPPSVELASWDAISVWNLQATRLTGPQGVTHYKVPGVDPWPVSSNIAFDGRAIVVRGPGTTLDGWDFRGWHVAAAADNVIISNNLFDSASRNQYSLSVLATGGPYHGIIFEHNLLDGGRVDTTVLTPPGGLWGGAICIMNSDSTEVRFNRVVNQQGGDVTVWGGVNVTASKVHDNYFGVAGYARFNNKNSLTHADLAFYGSGDHHKFYRNFLDCAPVGGVNTLRNPQGLLFGPTNAIRINSFSRGGILNGVDVYNNIEVGAHTWTYYPFASQAQNGGVNKSISVYDNLWEVGLKGNWAYPTHDGIILSSGNKQLSDGAPLVEL
jgi:hypothetical protein